MINAYTRGAVEVLYAGAVEVLYAGAVEVRSWCGRGTLVVRSRYARGAVEVRSWCGRGTLVVRSRYARGAVERSRYTLGTVLVRSRYARGAFPVRYVSLTFQRAILYVHVICVPLNTTLPSTPHSFRVWCNSLPIDILG